MFRTRKMGLTYMRNAPVLMVRTVSLAHSKIHHKNYMGRFVSSRRVGIYEIYIKMLISAGPRAQGTLRNLVEMCLSLNALSIKLCWQHIFSGHITCCGDTSMSRSSNIRVSRVVGR